MEPFPNEDIATEILSRLPAKSLMAFRCTAKKWYAFVYDPVFLRIHHERSKDILGLFLQLSYPFQYIDLPSVNLVTLTETGSYVEDTSLNFLPEKEVFIVSSTNGILCCRSRVYHRDNPMYMEHQMTRGLHLKGNQKNFAIYICNPATREWIKIKPKRGDDLTLHLGVAFNPNQEYSRFKLVNLQNSRKDPGKYSFSIYSSETRKWKTSSEVCEVNSSIYSSRVIFSNSRLHWLTVSHYIVTFHVEKEECKLMKLPGTTPYEYDLCYFGICLGESEGYFHYVCAFYKELHVWVLKDYEKPVWEVKHCLNLKEFYRRHKRILKDNFCIDEEDIYLDSNYLNNELDPVAFYDDIVYFYMVSYEALFAYNFKTERLINYCPTAQFRMSMNIHPILLPFSPSLAKITSSRAKRIRKRKYLIEY